MACETKIIAVYSLGSMGMRQPLTLHTLNTGRPRAPDRAVSDDIIKRSGTTNTFSPTWEGGREGGEEYNTQHGHKHTHTQTHTHTHARTHARTHAHTHLEIDSGPQSQTNGREVCNLNLEKTKHITNTVTIVTIVLWDNLAGINLAKWPKTPLFAFLANFLICGHMQCP